MRNFFFKIPRKKEAPVRDNSFGGVSLLKDCLHPGEPGILAYFPDFPYDILKQIRAQYGLRSAFFRSKRIPYRAPIKSGLKLELFCQSGDFGRLHIRVLAAFSLRVRAIDHPEKKGRRNPPGGRLKGIIWASIFTYFCEIRH